MELERTLLIYSLQCQIVWFVTGRDGLKWRNLSLYAFFAAVQEKIRLVPEFRVSYVEEREIITVKVIRNAGNVKGRGNLATACHVHDVEVKDSIDDGFPPEKK